MSKIILCASADSVQKFSLKYWYRIACSFLRPCKRVKRGNREEWEIDDAVVDNYYNGT